MKDLGAKKDGSGQKPDSSTPEPYRWRTQEFRVKILLRGIVVFSDDCASLPMTICERCGTENLGGSRYCDECGAALWLTGNEGEVSKGGPQGNGSQPNGSGTLAQREPSLVLANSSGPQSAVISEPETSAPLAGGKRRPHATLVIERGSSAGKKFLLIEKDANIGRWDADGGIFPDVDLDSDDPEAKVSRRHARISLNDGQYLIEDLGSTNGTFVNRGRRLAPGNRHPIKDGDEIIVGKTFLRFRVLN